MRIVQNPALCRMVNTLNLELLTFGYAKVSDQWFGSVRSPLFTRLYYVTEGACVFCGDDAQEIQLTEGNWYLIPSGYSFDFGCEDVMEHFYFHLKLTDYVGTDLLRNALTPLCLHPDQNMDMGFLMECTCSNVTLQGLRLRQLATEVLLAFVEKFNIPIAAEEYSPCIYKALTYIKQNLSMSLSIAEIADHIYVSKSTLTKHFQKELHMTVNQYICNAVMAKAEHLLITSNISMHDLSIQLGFTDQLYFSRRFREIFGKSPTQYRKAKLL